MQSTTPKAVPVSQIKSYTTPMEIFPLDQVEAYKEETQLAHLPLT